MGEALIAQAKTDAARETIAQVIREQPKSSQAYLALAALESSLQRPGRLRADLNTAIANDPGSPQVYLAKVIYLRGQGQLKQAINLLRRRIEADPLSDQIRFALAEALLTDRQSNEGMTLLRSIKRTGPYGTAAGVRLALSEIENNQLAAAAFDLKQLEQDGAENLPEVLYARARLLLAQDKTMDALHLLMELTDAAPEFAAGFYYLGIAYAASGDFQKAREQLETAVKLAPKAPQTYLTLGTVELRQGYYSAALEATERALQRDPDNIPALVLKGDVLFSQGREQEAEQAYRHVTQLAPQSSMAHARLGQLAAERNDRTTAAREFETALRLDPTRGALLSGLATALLKTQGLAAALNRIREQIKSQPENPDFHVLLAVFLMNDHQMNEASAELKTAIARDPNQPGLYFMLARLYHAQGKTAQVKSDLKVSLITKSKYGPTLLMLGAIADQEGRLEEAIGYYQKLITAVPNFGPAANNLAYDYLRENRNLDQALKLAQHARQLMPHDPHVADTLGTALLKRGLPENAVPLFRESIEANTQAEAPRYHLGFALLAIKQTSEAGEELNTALKLEPNAYEAGQAREALAHIAMDEAQTAKCMGECP
ncbi:MAG: tetratricopeptide repeat protein [Deltaproteobacteria bacterium]|nr:tetratricopeptide repeat protein [Deltaproteobacteria bacterium]